MSGDQENGRNGKRRVEDEAHIAMVRKHLRLGDTITHVRCMGLLEEHIYTGDDGPWLCGRATRDTARIGNIDREDRRTNDISPLNVKYVNRVPIDALDFVRELRPSSTREPAKG